MEAAEKQDFAQVCFQIDYSDNVATALKELHPGDVKVNGDSAEGCTKAIEKVPIGHKIALRDIAAGEKIIKYGVIIGESVKDIKKGSWVHLHNIRSIYDTRSSTLNPNTGVPTDTKYD